jgi:hypothetical protein
VYEIMDLCHVMGKSRDSKMTYFLWKNTTGKITNMAERTQQRDMAVKHRLGVTMDLYFIGRAMVMYLEQR